jgi:hypothetical protein
MKTDPKFKVVKVSEGIFFVDLFFDPKKKAKQEFWCLLRSDAHHDNPHSDNVLELKHLNQAVEKDAFILDNGDAFCAMQGKGDPRASKDDIKEKHKKVNYLDSLVTTYADFLEPFSHRMLIMGKGNHETAVLKHRETDLTQRLVDLLNGKTSSKIQCGQIANWVGIRAYSRDPRGRKIKIANHLWIYMFHGAGGGGPVTKGVIGANRMGVTHPDAKIVATGHTHDSWFFTNARSRITHDGTEYIDEQLHIKIPTYKNEYGVKDSGFHMEKGRPPKPLGAVWLNFKLHIPKDKNGFELKCDASRAD